jgi:hypothetical protein
MSNEEILKKAIEKAANNGYRIERGEDRMWSGLWYAAKIVDNEYYKYIVSHDFAKAFWGDAKVDQYGLTQEERSQACILPGFWSWHSVAWKHHLRQMVIEEDPLTYLDTYLEEYY